MSAWMMAVAALSWVVILVAALGIAYERGRIRGLKRAEEIFRGKSS